MSRDGFNKTQKTELKQEVFTKNLILSTEFDRYILEHTEIAEKIP